MTATGFRFLISGIVILCLASGGLSAQNLNGAWRLVKLNGKAFTDQAIKIYSDGYFMSAIYAADGGFIKAAGGTYQVNGTSYSEIPDFYTSDSAQVRRPLSYSFSLQNNELTISAKMQGDGLQETWSKVNESSSPLSGAWRFGARVNEDGVAGQRRGSDSPRRTMKILSGNYFQWAAFNYETKQFSGTGGGTYKLRDKQYTETILFFSRDKSRVGITLTFDCNLDGTDWYHKGKGTTGNPVSEVWEKVK
jgi:hypothetical protein